MTIKEQNTRLFAALDTVKTNAQAVYMADRALRHGAEALARMVPSGSIDPARSYLGRTLRSELDEITRWLGEIVADGQPVGRTWGDLRKAIQRLYGAIWSGEKVLGDSPGAVSEWLDFVGTVAREAAIAAPKIIGDTVEVIGSVAGRTAGNVLGGAVKGLWPWLLAAGALVAVGVVVYVKAPAAVRKAVLG